MKTLLDNIRAMRETEPVLLTIRLFCLAGGLFLLAAPLVQLGLTPGGGRDLFFLLTRHLPDLLLALTGLLFMGGSLLCLYHRC